jgi:hypothetical protein
MFQETRDNTTAEADNAEAMGNDEDDAVTVVYSVLVLVDLLY